MATYPNRQRKQVESLSSGRSNRLAATTSLPIVGNRRGVLSPNRSVRSRGWALLSDQEVLPLESD